MSGFGDPDVKKAAHAIRKVCGVRTGPMTPWERFKIMSYANTLADEVGMKQRSIEQLRAEAAEMERLNTAVHSGEMTEEEALARYKEIRQQADDRELPTKALMMNDEQITNDIGHKLVQQTKSNLQQQRDFVAEVQDAKLALELAVTTFRKSTIDFLEEMTKYLTDIRQTKVALGAETRQLVAQCQDVRTFFLSPEHVAEVQRLKEFVEICERLKALKESGFLDNIADTILKLAPTP